MAFNIAYPTKWHDYSSYKTKKDDLFFNTKELIKYGQRKEIQKAKKRDSRQRGVGWIASSGDQCIL